MHINYKTPGEYNGYMTIMLNGFCCRALQRDFKQLLKIIRLDLREDEHLEKLKDYLQIHLDTIKYKNEHEGETYERKRMKAKFEKFLSMMR